MASEPSRQRSAAMADVCCLPAVLKSVTSGMRLIPMYIFWTKDSIGRGAGGVAAGGQWCRLPDLQMDVPTLCVGPKRARISLYPMGEPSGPSVHSEKD